MWLHKAAQQGNADAQYYLGFMYYCGNGVPRDFANALKWYRVAADQGHADAAYNLGKMYGVGEGAPANVSEALKWYRSAADKGHAEAQSVFVNPLERQKAWAEEGSVIAQRKLARWYRDGEYQFRLWDETDGEVAEEGYLLMWICVQGEPQYAEALKWLRKAAEQGDSFAQLELGLMYRDLQGDLQDYMQAIHWISEAARQNSVGAQFELGIMYREGHGAKQDLSQALQWLRRAADSACPEAQLALGSMYRDGHGVLQDYAQAHMWFNLAAAHPRSSDETHQAARQRDLLAGRMAPTQVAEAQKLVRECFFGGEPRCRDCSGPFWRARTTKGGGQMK